MQTKSVILIIILLLSGMSLKAQQPFKPGDMVVGVSQGTGGKMDVTFYDKITPVKGIVVDFGLPIPMDSGFFGIGLLYGTRTIDYFKQYNIGPQYFLTYHWDYKIWGTRLTYHIDLLGIPNFDTYIGGTVTYIQVKWTPNDNLYYPFPPYGTAPINASNAKSNPYPTISYPNFVKFGGLVGARFDLFNFLGIFGEVSLGATNFTFGATLKI